LFDELEFSLRLGLVIGHDRGPDHCLVVDLIVRLGPALRRSSPLDHESRSRSPPFPDVRALIPLENLPIEKHIGSPVKEVQ
jgi:hypothetical protein